MDDERQGHRQAGRDDGVGLDYETRTAYVDYNVHDKSQPNFAFFGHEVWHLPELGGRFHK